MIEGIHFLLTYACNFECDHCFVYSSPQAKGTFTLRQLQSILKDAKSFESMQWIYFEGGEPFLYYPLMIEGIRFAHEMGFKVGVVTNAYYATNEEDAELWLRPLYDLGIGDLSISDDLFHYEDEIANLAKNALRAAEKIGLPVGSICIEKPTLKDAIEKDQAKGTPVIGGGAMFRGRAAEKLTEGLPRTHWETFTDCPYEELVQPKRVHIDSYGNVHLCQGLCMGNLWETPLSRMIEEYDASTHPVCGPIVKGGPTELARTYALDHDETYVDVCHFCYTLRMKLLDRFPQYLAPKQVYGLE